MIATGRYVSYAKGFLESAREHLGDLAQSEFLVFTDNADEIRAFCGLNPNIKVNAIEIPAYRWPEATLLRYQIFTDHWSEVRGQLAIYVDADTRFVTAINPTDFFAALGTNDLGLVRHPGYFRRSPILRLLFRTRFGPWERHRDSTARVPISKRKDYVCGGVWFGRTSAVEQMCLSLAEAVREDLKHGVIARFHDESHLNRYKIDNHIKPLDPRWAYAAGYRNLKGISPIIEVIHKPNTWEK